MMNIYRHSLAWALDNSVLMLIVLVLTIALNLVVIVRHSQGLLPAAGHGRDDGHDAGTAGRIVFPS